MWHYEMDPPAVHGSGQQVTGLVDGAAGLARRYLSSLETTRGQVHHPTVTAALDRYRDAWQQPVRDVAREIDSLGGSTGASAVTIAGTDQDGYTLLAGQTATTGAQASQLSRPVNTAIPV